MNPMNKTTLFLLCCILANPSVTYAKDKKGILMESGKTIVVSSNTTKGIRFKLCIQNISMADADFKKMYEGYAEREWNKARLIANCPQPKDSYCEMHGIVESYYVKSPQVLKDYKTGCIMNEGNWVSSILPSQKIEISADSGSRRAIMMEIIDDPLASIGVAGSQLAMMRKAIGDDGIAVQFRHCIQSKSTLEAEYRGRYAEAADKKFSGNLKKIELLDHCPQPANAQCVRKSGERTDYYYTKSLRVLENFANECEPKMHAKMGKDHPLADMMEKMQEMAQEHGGKWTTSVANEEMSDFLSTTTKPVKTEAELKKEAQERGQAGQDAMGLAFFGNRMKDKASILELLKEEPGAIRLLDDKFKKDKEIILAAVTKNGKALQYADNSLKKDEEVVLAAIKNRADAYKHADESLQNSKAFAMKAIKHNPNALRFIPEQFKDNEESVLAEIRRSPSSYDYYSLPKKYKKDKEFLLKAVTVLPAILSVADKSVLKDQAFINSAIKNNIGALAFASKKMRSNKKLILKAIKEGAGGYIIATKKLKNDKEVVMAAVRKDGNALMFISKKFKTDKNVVLAAIKQAGGTVLVFIPDSSLGNDKDIKAAIKEFNDKRTSN